ncbi:phage integrase central domain-containing protein [Paraburkholderia phytofirmans]|uniref:phage integrase central domain-containing protein n=1 Tax=Paraburkholderia phytofirmans TaxID=261302 RepID=UPI0002FE11B8
MDQSKSHADRNLRRLEVHVFPYVGDRPTTLIELAEVLDVLQHVEKKGTIETAHRVRSRVGQSS